MLMIIHAHNSILPLINEIFFCLNILYLCKFGTKQYIS